MSVLGAAFAAAAAAAPGRPAPDSHVRAARMAQVSVHNPLLLNIKILSLDEKFFNKG